MVCVIFVTACIHDKTEEYLDHSNLKPENMRATLSFRTRGIPSFMLPTLQLDSRIPVAAANSLASDMFFA